MVRAWDRTRGALLCLGILASLGACGSSDPVAPGPGDGDVVRYRVTFDATWSATTHPTQFPPGPHFSGLVGATHASSFVMWRTGEAATLGIKNMAETGSKTALLTEVNTAIQAGSAEHVLSGAGVNPSPDQITLTFSITEAFPLVSLVSMIAPSPDWFVGVRDLSLRENGEWVDELTVNLLPYDAGTDSGASFTSPNSATIPPVVISLIDEMPLAGGVPLGTFTFERL